MKQLSNFGGLGHTIMLIKLTSRALQKQSIGIALPTTLKTIVSLTSFLLMVLPLKLVLIIVSEENNWSVYGIEISKHSILSFISLVYLFLIVLHFAAKNVLLKVKNTQSLTYDGIPKYELNDPQAKTKTLSLFNNLTDFYSSFFLLITYTAICFLISWPTIFMLGMLVFGYALLISGRIKDQISENSNINSFFRISTTVFLLMYISFFLLNSGIIVALLLFLSGRQWCTQITQLGSVLSVFNRRLDLPLEIYRYAQKTGNKKILAHRQLPIYFSIQTQLQVFQKVYADIGNSLGRPFKAEFMQMKQASLNCFSITLKTESGDDRNDLILFYTDTELYLKESLVLNCIQGSRYCPIYLKIPGTELNGFLLKDIRGKKLKQGVFAEILPDLLFELWRVDPKHNTNMLSSGHLFIRYFRPSYFELLKSITTSDYEIKMIERLEDAFSDIVEKLNKMPKTLFHPFLSNELMFLDKGDNPKLVAWGYSTIEPVGSQLYRLKNISNLAIENILQNLRKHRDDFRHVKSTDLEIASLCFEIAQKHKLTLYSDAKCAAISLGEIFNLECYTSDEKRGIEG